MPRYEFSEGGSNKFWEIERDKKSVTTRYGRIGSDGQATSKSFDSEEKAIKEYDRLIAEKTRKGYLLAKGSSGGKSKSKPLPKTRLPALVRTDFKDAGGWKKLKAKLEEAKPDVDEILAFVDDKVFDGMSNKEVTRRLPKGYEHSFVILADAKAMKGPDFPVQVVSLEEGEEEPPGSAFRSVVAHVTDIADNLSLGNMDFYEFAEVAEETRGVYRGIPDEGDEI
jgi:predicted DNA-binding WGR domain protein